MKLIEKYTNDYYASIMEIKNDFNVMGSHLIIDEIEKYRERYKIHFMFQNQKYSFVLIPRIQELMNQHLDFHESHILHPMIQIFMLRNDPIQCLKCLQTYHLSEKYLQTFDYIYSFEEDITKSFLEWLEHLKQYSFTKVLHYEYKMNALNEKQKLFYIKYCDEYFDIEEYRMYMHISYETARLHLSKMVSLGIFSSHKIGKKLIYKGEL